VRPIVKLFDFVRADGAIFHLAIVLGATQNQLYNRGTSPWTLIGTFATAYATPDALGFTNLVLFAAGYETPKSYDGTTFQALTSSTGTVPGGAQHHTLHQGFYWLWNTAAASGTLDGPSSLRSSDLNNPNSWPNANQIFVDKDDGDSGAGMGQFTVAETGISPSTSQILFKNFSAYQMSGVFGSTSPAFSIQRVKSDMGCVAPRSIHFAPGFGLIRLAHRGFALFDGVDDRLISEEIRPMLFGTLGFTSIDWTNVSKAMGELIPNPPLYVCGCPTPGTGGLTRWFVYDLVRRAWTVLQFSNPIATIQAIENPNTLPVVLAGDFNGGSVRRVFSGDATDDGQAIAWQVNLKPAFGSSPQQNAYYRRLIVKATNVVAGQVITGFFAIGPTNTNNPIQTLSAQFPVPAGTTQFIINGNFGANYQVKVQAISLNAADPWFTDIAVQGESSTGFTVVFSAAAPDAGGLLGVTVTLTPLRSPLSIQKTLQVPTTVGANIPNVPNPAGGLGFGQQPFGTSPFGGSTTSAPEIDLSFDIHAIGANVRGVLSGAGPITIRGIEWHLRQKPLSRPSVYAP
jgi:hypothetical protein